MTMRLALPSRYLWGSVAAQTAVPAVEVREVGKNYGGKIALRDVDFVVHRGEICGLVGANGAGKSTLVSLIAGLIRPTSGRIFLNGVDISRDRNFARQFVGLAPQDLGVYPTLTVTENLMAFGRLQGLRGRALRSAVQSTAGDMGLDGLGACLAGKLSGGERRRLHVAAAFLGDPPVVLLDEATAGSDVPTRERLIECVRSRVSAGAAVIYSTHVLSEIEELAVASVLVLHQGRLLMSGNSGAICEKAGGAAIMLRFSGPAPAQTQIDGTIDGSVMTVPTAEPTREIIKVLEALGEHRARLETVDVVRPSLERAYIELIRRSGEHGSLAHREGS